MNGIRSSLMLSIADSHLGLILQIVSTIILSRLLTPSEVGVFAIAAVFAAIGTAFRDFGVAEYLIQEGELTKDKIRAAFALNITVSWLVALLILLAAPFVASFYREKGVGDVMRVLAMNFVLVPFGAVIHAWFRRELNYRPIVICNLLSSIAAAVASIVLAYRGHGYMSLAWSSLIGIAVVVLATAWYCPKDFPRWPSFKHIGPVFHFSKFASLIYIFAQVGKGAPELIIGRALGAADVGIFSRANGLIEMFQKVLLRPVLLSCLPYFASQVREKGAIASAYTSSVSLLTAVGWPFLAVIAVMAFAAIRIGYGSQWLAAVPLAQVLCLACAIELLYLPSREALLAYGGARRASILQLQIVAMQVLGLLSAIPFGLSGAVWGVVLASICGVALSQWHLRAVGVNTWRLLRACAASLVLTFSAAGPLAAFAWIYPIDEANFLWWFALGVPVAAIGWLSTLRLQEHALWLEIREFLRRSILRVRRATP